MKSHPVGGPLLNFFLLIYIILISNLRLVGRCFSPQKRMSKIVAYFKILEV